MIDTEKKEFVWVEKEFAEKYKEIEKESSKTEDRLKIFNEYIKKVSDKSKAEYKANLETLEEDVAMYSGLMLAVKQKFEKAKDTAIIEAYQIWEEYDKEIPNIDKKVNAIIEKLNPLQDKLDAINKSFGKISTYNIEKVIDTIRIISDLYGNNEKMFTFLVDNFRIDQ